MIGSVFALSCICWAEVMVNAIIQYPIKNSVFFSWHRVYNRVACCRLLVQVDTVDENENETAGRGMIANREIKEGDELFTLPIDLLLTKDAARKVYIYVMV